MTLPVCANPNCVRRRTLSDDPFCHACASKVSEETKRQIVMARVDCSRLAYDAAVKQALQEIEEGRG